MSGETQGPASPDKAPMIRGTEGGTLPEAESMAQDREGGSPEDDEGSPSTPVHPGTSGLAFLGHCRTGGTTTPDPHGLWAPLPMS